MLKVAMPSKVPLHDFDRLSQYDKKIVRRVLDALGVRRVTRAMVNVCKPEYDNQGWRNCFLTQAFGGKANFDRMVKAQGYTVNSAASAVASKLYLSREDIFHFITMFDDRGLSAIDNTHIYFRRGKVAELLRYATKWLAKNGVDLSLTYSPASSPTSV